MTNSQSWFAQALACKHPSFDKPASWGQSSLSKYHCNINKACAWAVLEHNDQVPWVIAVQTVSSDTPCIFYSGERGCSYLAKCVRSVRKHTKFKQLHLLLPMKCSLHRMLSQPHKLSCFPLGVDLTYQLSRFVLSLVDEVFKAFLHGIDELGVLAKANLNDVVQLVLEIWITHTPHKTRVNIRHSGMNTLILQGAF